MNKKNVIKQLTSRFECSEAERFSFLSQNDKLKQITPYLNLSGSPFIAASSCVNYLENIQHYWGYDKLTGIELLEDLLNEPNN